MERTIDRTSYRRSARTNLNLIEKVQEPKIKMSNKRFKIVNLFLNQTIVSLLIIIGVLSAKYFDMSSVTDFLSKNLSGGYGAIELASKIKQRLIPTNTNAFMTISSGEEQSGDISGEQSLLGISGETMLGAPKIYSGEFVSAVEGVNQMAEDANTIKEQYHFSLPLKGTITSRFGSRESDNPIVSSYHTGLDIAANTGSEIYAAHSGKITMAKLFASYGNCIMIEDGNLTTVYAHCSSLLVKEGQNVKQGDVIAKVGMTGNATGPHLHFEVRYEGRFVDPENVLSDL